MVAAVYVWSISCALYECLAHLLSPKEERGEIYKICYTLVTRANNLREWEEQPGKILLVGELL